MSEVQDETQFEIGHVLFIDIVGYSKLLIEEQKEGLNQLTEIVLATSQVRESTDEVKDVSGRTNIAGLESTWRNG